MALIAFAPWAVIGVLLVVGGVMYPCERDRKKSNGGIFKE